MMDNVQKPTNPECQNRLESALNCCFRKLNGYKCGGVFKFRQPVVLLRDPQLVKTVIVKEFSSFQDNDFHSNVDIDPLFGRNPFVLRGDV
jgi:hypothetical protein